MSRPIRTATASLPPIEAHLAGTVTEDGQTYTAPVLLSYVEDDPAAVTATVSPGCVCGYHVASWTFARQLLGEGFDGTAGDGAVRVVPWPVTGRIELGLWSPGRALRVWLPADDVATFLARTFLAVSAERERALLAESVHAAAAALLAEARP